MITQLSTLAHCNFSVCINLPARVRIECLAPIPSNVLLMPRALRVIHAVLSLRYRGREPKLPPILSVLLWCEDVLLFHVLAHSAPWVAEHLTSSLVGGCCIRCREHDVFEKLFSTDAVEVAQYFVVHVVLDDEHLGGSVLVHTGSGWVGLVRHGIRV